MNEELVKNGIFPMGEENPYGNFFIGQSYLQSLAKSPDESLSVGNVTFEPRLPK